MYEARNWPKKREFESKEEAEKQPLRKTRKYIPIEIKIKQIFRREIYESFALKGGFSFEGGERITIYSVDYKPSRYAIDFKLFDDNYYMEGYELNNLMRRLAKIILANYEKEIDHDY